MIETVAASAPLTLPKGRVTSASVPPGWTYRRHGPVHTWTHPDPPPGISRMTICEHPDSVTEVDPFTDQTLSRQTRIKTTIEGNATACRYGEHLTWASLTKDETPDALLDLLDFARQAAPFLEEDPSLWTIDRLDPSATWQLPDSLSASQVIDSTRREWAGTRSSKSTLDHHSSNGDTVTLRVGKGLSWSVYDKTAAATKAGQRPLANLLRTEVRLRPKTLKSEHYKGFSPTLAMTATDQEFIVNELESLSKAVVTLAASGTLMIVRRLMTGGATANTALRLAAVYELQAAYGPAIFNSLDVPDRSAARWKAETRKYLGDDPAVVMDDLIDDLPATARAVYAATQTVGPPT